MNEEQMLDSLLSGELLEAAKYTDRFGVWYEKVIGIGNDHVAYITLSDDALDELKRRKRELEL
jgi:hypothetical protein